MSIFYFYLAKFEENRMVAKDPEYLEYMKKTAMFIPGNPGGKIFDETTTEFRDEVDAVRSECLCDCNYSCTCNCNYCVCNCNHVCQCNCNYSDRKLKENIVYL